MLAGLAAAVGFAVFVPSLPERLIYDFPSNWLRGGLPAAALIEGDRGATYGTTVFGGTGACNDIYPGCGTVFELTPQRHGGFKQNVVYNFQGQNDGSGPSGLVRDRKGALYGIAIASNHRPLLFRLSPTATGYSETTLYRFPDIQLPSGPLTLGPDGSLYGTNISFSTKSQTTYGMVFRFRPSAAGFSEQILYNFQTVPSGISPRAPLLVDSNGVVYGATAFGGTRMGPDCINRGCGTIFRLTPSPSGYKLDVLYRFSGSADGYLPSALIRDASGTLYGATSFGGPNSCPDGSCGTVFAFNVAARTLKTLYNFTSSGLWYPSSQPTLDRAGAIYGTNSEYGANNQNGGIYKLTPTPSGYVESVAHVFASSPSDGSSSSGGLLLSSSGEALYGTTYWGGNGIGTVFELNI